MFSAYRSGPCFGMGSFNEGHGDVLRGNKCLIVVDSGKYEDNSSASATQKMREALLREKYGYNNSNNDDPYVGGLWQSCEDSPVILESNEYYTPDGTAMVVCNGDEYHKLEDMAPTFGLEVNSTVSVLPDIRTILAWAEAATNPELFLSHGLDVTG